MASYSLLRYLAAREKGNRNERRLLREKLLTDNTLHRKDLLAHYGCVNAVEFSSEGGKLASGGDDRRVLLWPLDKTITGEGKPVALVAEHRSNIFCLGFDTGTTRLYSGGNDEQVIAHDLQTGEPLDWLPHEEPVYGLSVHPSQPDTLLTACSDGRVLCHDLRGGSSSESMLAGCSHAFHAVHFNPVQPHLVATSNDKVGVGLWDLRRPGCCLLQYGGGRSASMHVTWNCRGDRLLGLRRRLPPVLYKIESPIALAQFDHPGYYNSCTMKSCCFGGEDDTLVMSGSDDFNVYAWRVPEEGGGGWVSRAQHVLQGHRSIVNQVRYNHSRAVIATSGVEKVVKLWSALPLPQARNNSRESGRNRQVYSHDEYIRLVMRSDSLVSHDYSNQSVEENPQMMAFFDSLVQREIEGFEGSNSSSSSSSGEDANDEEEYSQTVVEPEEDEDEEDQNLGSESGGNVESENEDRLDSEIERRERVLQRISLNVADGLLSSDVGARHRVRVVEEVGGPSNSFSRAQETQTSPENSQNRIAALIARRRDVIVKRAQKEEKGNAKYTEEKIKRAARLLKEHHDQEPDVEESSDEEVEDDDGRAEEISGNEMERQEEIDRLLGDLSESRSKSSFSNPRLVALRQRRLKLLLSEDSDSSDSETGSAIEGTSKTLVSGNLSNQTEPFVAGKGPGPSYEAAADLHEVENQGAVSFRGALGCDSRLPASEGSSDLQESSEAGTSVSSETSREKVHFKKPGSQRGGRCIRKRSHDPD